MGYRIHRGNRKVGSGNYTLSASKALGALKTQHPRGPTVPRRLQRSLSDFEAFAAAFPQWLGRFAQMSPGAYRRHFGELPSETLDVRDWGGGDSVWNSKVTAKQ